MLVSLNLQSTVDLPNPPSLWDDFSIFDELIVPGPGKDSHSNSLVASNVNSNDAALELSASNIESKKTIAEVKLLGQVKELKAFAPFTPFQVTGVNKIF